MKRYVKCAVEHDELEKYEKGLEARIKDVQKEASDLDDGYQIFLRALDELESGDNVGFSRDSFEFQSSCELVVDAAKRLIFVLGNCMDYIKKSR